MRYPEFSDAQCHIKNSKNKKILPKLVNIFLKVIIYIIIIIITLIITYLFFKHIIFNNSENSNLNFLSVGASIITVYSAIISILSLIDSECLKKYSKDLELLESRYLNNKKISGWNFLNRFSKNISHYNYYVESAYFKIFYGENEEKLFKIIIPTLKIDFKDISCIKQIYMINNILPDFVTYIIKKQKEYNDINSEKSVIQPIYYIPLLDNIKTLYINILIHKVLVNTIVLLGIAIISTIIITLKFFL